MWSARELLTWPAIECYLCGVLGRYAKLYRTLAPAARRACPARFALCPVDGEPAPTFRHRDDDQVGLAYRRRPGACSGEGDVIGARG